jgi:hypothetical protein
MFNEVEGLMKRAVSGEIDQSQLQQAAEQHVQSIDDKTIAQNVEQAASNAQQNGQPDLAQQIRDLLQKDGANPQALKQDVIALIKNNPEVLKHFEGSFAKNILSRIGL